MKVGGRCERHFELDSVKEYDGRKGRVVDVE
jgi:hypothetical protein